MVTAITVPTIRDAPASTTSANSSTGNDDQNHRDDEVNDLHYFVKRRHLRFEVENKSRDDQPAHPGLDESRQVTAVEESVSRKGLVFGTGLAHTDNTKFDLQGSRVNPT